MLCTVEIVGEVYKENEQYYNIFSTTVKHYKVNYEELFNELTDIIKMEEFSEETYFSILDIGDDKKESSMIY